LSIEITESEKTLIIKLAEEGAKSGYRIHTKEKIMGNSTWEKIRKRLLAYGLIREEPTLERDKPYILTLSGVTAALFLGADYKKTVNQYREKYDELKLFIAWDSILVEDLGAAWENHRSDFFSNYALVMKTLLDTNILGNYSIFNTLDGFTGDFLVKKVGVKREQATKILEKLKDNPELVAYAKKYYDSRGFSSQ